MSNEDKKTNERGNQDGQFSQGVGGFAEYTVSMTDIKDKVRHDVKVPPKKVIPVVFLPGVMGSNLRMSQARQRQLEKKDNRAWRPDDLASSPISAATSTGFPGWYRDLTPAQRQMVFDPNETEVDYYKYSENKGKFDPEGKETLEADARHENIVSGMESIPPLLVSRYERRVHQFKLVMSTAQMCRWRGWSEVMYDGAYGKMLRYAEAALNNIPREKLPPYLVHLSPWSTLRDFTECERDKPQLGKDLAITEQEQATLKNAWFPVHAMGYNYLKSNIESSKTIAERIRGLVRGYQQRGFSCNEAIVVTHSMGGLVSRALIHPSYGNLLADPNVKLLGIYHSAMPTLGAAASYRRMRFGFKEQDSFAAGIFAEIIGKNGEHATAILANTPAPLELLPSVGYGKDWLKVIDGSGKTVRSWPHGEETALQSIYLQPPDKWWRLVNPEWVNPARFSAEKGGGIEHVYRRLARATKFIDSIEKTFHPTQSYASYCAAKDQKSFGDLVFKIMNPEIWDASQAKLPPADSWTLLSDDGLGTLTVQAGDRVLQLQVQAGTDNGDGTVPAERSARKIVGKLFAHGSKEGESYDHQNSYANNNVLASMLYSIAKIAGTAKWN